MLMKEKDSEKIKSKERRNIPRMISGPMKIAVKIIFVVFNEAFG